MTDEALKSAADRICAGENPDDVREDFPHLLFFLCPPRPKCEHVYDGPGVESDDGLSWSITCSKCGAAAIDDWSIWDD